MTCIEKYNEQKNITTKIISNLNKAKGLTAIGEEDPHNDKYGFNFYDHSIWSGDISVYFHASYGYYGDLHINEPSYVISQKDMVKLLNYVRSLH